MLWKSICIAEKRTFNWVSLSGLLTAERKKFPWRCISPQNLVLKGNVIRAVMKIEFFQCLRMAFFNELSTLPALKRMQTFWPALTLLFSPSFHPVWQASPLPFPLLSPHLSPFWTPDFLRCSFPLFFCCELKSSQSLPVSDYSGAEVSVPWDPGAPFSHWGCGTTTKSMDFPEL